MPRWWTAGFDWLDALPGLVERQCRAWDLVADGEPVHGSNALVLPVRRGHEPLALRLAPPADAAEDVTPLRFWAGRGTVLLVDHDVDAGALLLERLDPHRTLATVPPDQASAELGSMMRRLAVPAPNTVPFSGDLVAERLDHLTEDWVALHRPVPRRIVDHAIEAGHSLESVDGSCATNGDLHHDQVLAGNREPWLCVDARLLRGDRSYDLARSLWYRLDALTDDTMINQQLLIIAEAAGVDHDHARRSALYRTVDYWLWGMSHGLTEDPVRCARLVGALLSRRR